MFFFTYHAFFITPLLISLFCFRFFEPNKTLICILAPPAFLGGCFSCLVCLLKHHLAPKGRRAPSGQALWACAAWAYVRGLLKHSINNHKSGFLLFPMLLEKSRPIQKNSIDPGKTSALNLFLGYTKIKKHFKAGALYNQHIRNAHTLQPYKTPIKPRPKPSNGSKAGKIKGSGFSGFVARRAMILPQHLGHVFFVHNGKTYNSVSVSPKMYGHKFGEFASTRKKPFHKKKK